MFCRKCGKTLLDGDRFCSYCGAQVIERNDCIDSNDSEEEVIYNEEILQEKSFDDKTKSSENINNVASSNSILQTWQGINDKSEELPTNPSWNLDGFPSSNEQNKRTEDIKVDWKKREFLTFDTSNENKESTNYLQPERVHKNEIKLNIKDNQDNKLDIFEIYDKQTDEEKTKKEEKSFEAKQKPLDCSLEQELFGRKNNKDKTLHSPVEEQIDKFYTFSQKNEEFQKLLDKEYERIKKSPDFIAPEPKLSVSLENLELEMKENSFEKQSDTNLEKEKTKEKDIHDLNTDEIEKENLDKETETVLEKQDFEKQDEDNLGNDLNLEKFDNFEDVDKEEETENIPVLPWDEMESPLEEFKDEDGGKKASPMTIVLVIIIILLAFEVTILGIKCFLPESSAATFINNKLGLAVNWVDALKNEKGNNIEEKASIAQEKQTPKENEESAQEANAIPKADPIPNPNKEELISELLVYNENIKSITYDSGLVYIENKSYKDKNINNSKPIENNIWYKDENENTVYYDKEVIKAVIQFDSAWIDYVNTKNKTVLDLTKNGSLAYENAKNFSKVGKITETFDSLKIGEIRQSEKGFYVWANESITTTELGKSLSNNHNWVYYLEPVDKQMKIVSYSKF